MLLLKEGGGGICLTKVSRAVDLLRRVGGLELGQVAQCCVDARDDREG